MPLTCPVASFLRNKFGISLRDKILASPGATVRRSIARPALGCRSIRGVEMRFEPHSRTGMTGQTGLAWSAIVPMRWHHPQRLEPGPFHPDEQESSLMTKRSEPAGQSRLGRAYALSFLTLICAFNYFDRQLLGLLLPQIKAELALSDTQIGLTTGLAFVLCYSLAGVPLARLADRVGRRSVIAYGFAFWSLATLATGWVTSAVQLAAARFLTGAGEASGVAPSNAMVSDLISPQRRSLGLGLLSSGNAMGAIFLFPLAGWIAATSGWRAAFFAAGGAGFLLAVVFRLTVREPIRARQSPEARTSLKTAMGQMLQVRSFRLSMLAGCAMGISLYATQIWSPTFLERIHSLSVTEIAASIGPIRGASSLLGALLGGWLSSRLERRDIRWLLWLPGLAVLAVVPADLLFIWADSLTIALIGYALAGLLTTMHLVPLYAALLRVAPPATRATAMALFLLVVNLVGQIAGPLVVGMLNDSLATSLGAGAIRIGMVAAALAAGIAGLVMLIAAGSLPTDATRFREGEA